jgi:PAS domain S-box-containing protein
VRLAHVVENRVVPHNLGRYLAQIATVFAVQFAAGKMGDVLHTMNSGGIGPVWPASGIALGAVLVWGYSVWPGIAGGAFFLTFLGGLPLWAAVVYAAGTTLAALLPAFLLRRIVKFDNTLSHLGDVVGLIMLGAFGGSVVSASIGVPTLYAAQISGWSGFGWAWLIYWFGDSTGVLVVTPLVLTLATPFRVRDRNRRIELAALLLLLMVACFILFGILPIWLDILTFAILPFVMWAAIRFGTSVTALSIFLLATIATAETALGYGPFAANTPLINALLLDVLFGVVSITGLTLAAVSAEREQSLRQQAAMETRLLADEALRESEDKLRLLLDSTAEAIYGVDLEQRCTFCNAACLRILGYQHVDEVLGKNMHNLIHHTRADGTSFPIEECRIHQVTRTGEGVHAEDELLWRANGTGFPAEYWSHPQWKEHGVVGAVVAFIDITERKLAEAALASVSRRLIEAQEQERSRIGRDLHDDIGQRLALLAVELQHLHQDSFTLPEVRSRIGELQKQTSEIARDTQSLSHELHSAKLQYLGIAVAMRSFCKEFGELQKVEIDFQNHDLPSPVAPDTSLCLYRVLQEALHNSAKHSGVRHLEVRLWGTLEEIHLTVRDSGVGFDREAAKTSRGLGLISMEERLKVVNGTLSIDSQPKGGTMIHARVPVSSGTDRVRAAG